MDKRSVVAAVALLAAVDVGLWFAVFQRSTPPVGSSSGSAAGETSRTTTASPEPSASTASAAPPSEQPTEQPTAEPPPAESPSPEPSDEQPQVELTSGPVSAAAYETVPIQGVLNGVQEATTLRVQVLQDGRWTTFPLPTTTDAEGRFTAYVELGGPGEYPVRVLDPLTGATSAPVVVTIT